MEGNVVRSGQTTLAVAAAVSLLPALAIGLPSGLGGLYFLAALPVALPFFLRRAPRAFARACLVVGTVLSVWVVVGFVVGMFLLVPAAALLLTAAFLDPWTRPGAWGVLAVPVVPTVSGLLLYGFPG
ncbi:hypothetical protein [Streptomyces sp. NPDC058955]|uniref:hypothetical protein n=1 Tax=unclassified Streptomyces TaxID=2593676 RepID=UPI0036601444